MERLTTENAEQYLGKTLWVRIIGPITKIFVFKSPSGDYYYMYEDGTTCDMIPTPDNRYLSIQIYMIEYIPELFIQPKENIQ